MGVPAGHNIKTLTGSYTLNATLSDSSDTILKMQNVGFLVRQAVKYSSITIILQQYTSPDGKAHLDQEQISTGGIKNFEDRIMDWEWTEKENWIWGLVKGRSRYVKMEEIDDEWLREGWTGDEDVVEGVAENAKNGWVARQIWGFAEVDGERRHVRRILGTRKGWKDQRIRMVYDWKAPVDPVVQAE